MVIGLSFYAERVSVTIPEINKVEAWKNVILTFLRFIVSPGTLEEQQTGSESHYLIKYGKVDVKAAERQTLNLHEVNEKAVWDLVVLRCCKN